MFVLGSYLSLQDSFVDRNYPLLAFLSSGSSKYRPITILFGLIFHRFDDEAIYIGLHGHCNRKQFRIQRKSIRLL
jgi:hypothetical protein